MLFYLLILIALYGIAKIIIEINEQDECPSYDDLKRVVLGLTKKNTRKAEQVIRHLGVCEKCQEKVRGIGQE